MTKKTPEKMFWPRIPTTTWILKDCFNTELFFVILSEERELCILLTLFFRCSDMSVLLCVIYLQCQQLGWAIPSMKQPQSVSLDYYFIGLAF